MSRITVFLLFLLLIVTHQAHAEKNGLDFQVLGRASYTLTRFLLKDNSKATYEGVSYGGEFVSKAHSASYGIAFVGGYYSYDLANTANANIQSENLSGSTFYMGSRFYALNLFMGAGVHYSTFKVNYTNNNTITDYNYKGPGLRIECGVDLTVRNFLVISPKIQYDWVSATSNDEAGTKKLSDFAAGIGLGFQF